MKKTLKGMLLFVLVAVLSVSLAGCGADKDKKDDNKKNAESNKLVATKKIEDNSYLGEYVQTVEAEFDDEGKATKITLSMELKDENTAKTVADVYKLANNEEEDSIKVSSDGNKLIITMDPKLYAEQEGVDSNQLTRENFKAELEEDGYEIK